MVNRWKQFKERQCSIYLNFQWLTTLNPCDIFAPAAMIGTNALRKTS